MFPCTFFLSSNHCVDKCDKRKTINNAMFMSTRIETERRKSHPKIKASELRGAQKVFCTHCNISGHWVKKCWKLFPNLHPSKGREIMQAPEEEAIIEKVAQDATIPETTLEEEKVQIDVSFTWLGKKWADYLCN